MNEHPEREIVWYGSEEKEREYGVVESFRCTRKHVRRFRRTVSADGCSLVLVVVVADKKED